MACYYCLGYCDSISITTRYDLFFDDEELEQAKELALQLPASTTATLLRMFFCLEVAQKILSMRLIDMRTVGEFSDLLAIDWAERRIDFTHQSLRKLTKDVRYTLEQIAIVNLEMKIRDLGTKDMSHVSADMFSQIAPKIKDQLNYFLSFLMKLRAFMRTSVLLTPRKAKKASLIYLLLLNSIGFSRGQKLSVFNYMTKITETESISPWTTQLPIFPE